ncbi:MAG: hypothetical protein JWN77_2674 [Frankiales bacterium]|jgi:thymidylate kinase|nr:hypothetical protein [Frankiales bacterium]
MRTAGTTGAVIAISGLDGAGKSTQAELLSQALAQAGYEPVVLWQRISHNAWLQRLTAPLRLVLRLLLRLRPSAAAQPAPEAAEWYVEPEHLTARALRERIPFVSALWVTLVAGIHAVAVRRETVRELRQGRVVIRDRYLLDSLVQLRTHYATTHGVAAQSRLVRWLTPPAVATFYLDVPAEEARRRKPEEYSVVELQQHRQVYLEQAAALEVPVLDGLLPAAQLHGQVAQAVLAALQRRSAITPARRPRPRAR